MRSRIRFSSVGEFVRVSDSTQPVHSCMESQITDGRFAFASACATAGAMLGGSAMSEVSAVQNLRKARRLTPLADSESPKVVMAADPPSLGWRLHISALVI